MPSGRRPRWLVAAALIVAAARPGRADQRAPTASLGLTRGPRADACITARDLALRVESRLGHATFVSAAQADLFIDARIERAEPGWHATVAATRASGARIGVRELASSGGDCRGLDEDLVLVIALAIDPLASPGAAPVAPAQRETIYVAVPVVTPARRWSFEARIAAGLVDAVLPAPTLAIELAVAAAPPGAWPIEVGAIATRSASAGDAAHGADLRLALGTLAVCPTAVERDRYRVQLCAGGAVGALAVHPRGLDPGSGGEDVAAAALGRARGAVRIADRVSVVAELAAVVPLIRRSLYYTALDPSTLQITRHSIDEVAVVGWAASLGLGVHFP
jgi:hypothetical protein